MDDVSLLGFRVVFASVLAAVAGVPLAAILGFGVLLRRRLGSASVTGATIGMLALYSLSPFPRVGAMAAIIAVPATRFPIVTADLLMSRAAREDIVQLASSGRLQPGEYAGQYRLLGSEAGLSVWGDVEVFEEACGTKVFFMTVTGFSPDPYGGFEYVPDGCIPDADPLGSGAGSAYPLGGPWYWIEAS